MKNVLNIALKEHFKVKISDSFSTNYDTTTDLEESYAKYISWYTGYEYATQVRLPDSRGNKFNVDICLYDSKGDLKFVVLFKAGVRSLNKNMNNHSNNKLGEYFRLYKLDIPVIFLDVSPDQHPMFLENVLTRWDKTHLCSNDDIYDAFNINNVFDITLMYKVSADKERITKYPNYNKLDEVINAL